jgi:hypothetical protein
MEDNIKMDLQKRERERHGLDSFGSGYNRQRVPVTFGFYKRQGIS